ncbi:MAG: beta galactosidase jelly roll domain-containing protein [Bacteroidota bacterium]|nr:beta galactosidase jelly roll domain-containing protein [Bacteroidota bacterium]
MIKKIGILTFILNIYLTLFAQENLIGNLPARKTITLDGKWQYIIDPYETGFYNYRLKERNENDKDAYWNSDVPENKTDRKEHGYINKYSLKVPGDWNSQEAKLLYYEGTIWYRKTFNFRKSNLSDRIYIYFEAVNYKADVYLNGHKLGTHKGGFTPFNFEIPDSIIRSTNNFLVVKVDNKRYADEVPTVNTDWWNYGGITRSVDLIEVPSNFIQDYSLQLIKSKNTTDAELAFSVKLNGNKSKENVTVEIPELDFKKTFSSGELTPNVKFKISNLQYWSPEHPKLYRVIIKTATDKIEEKIGFRTIEVKGKQILLNGKPIFMRGISIHEEIASEMRRAYSISDAAILLHRAKELNCNMVRLAHYPHNEHMTRLADSLGILVWSEIPVYWTIEFTNPAVFDKAKKQLTEMITRDHNRASIIIWSVGNETPVSESRTRFMSNLISAAKQLDSTRLVSAALEVNYNSGRNMNIIDDPLGEFTDIVAFNEYLGWYGGLPNQCRTTNWGVTYNKPLFISETGAEAVGGFHADSLTMWSEDYQQWYYREQTKMLERMPDNFVGISPWILNDFRSPRRNNPVYQQGWNNKGVYDHKGRKKKAFYVLKSYYDKMEKQHF